MSLRFCHTAVIPTDAAVLRPLDSALCIILYLSIVTGLTQSFVLLVFKLLLLLLGFFMLQDSC